MHPLLHRALLCAALLAPGAVLAQQVYDDLILAVVNDRVPEITGAVGLDPESPGRRG